ncbi:MAG: hypothetical protein WAS07_05075, partial [Micropruina sp.]
FAQRRKMLRAALNSVFGGAAEAQAALVAAGVDPQARGEVLQVEEFVRIAEQLPGGGPEIVASLGRPSGMG